jgi:hypothetical protein
MEPNKARAVHTAQDAYLLLYSPAVTCHTRQNRDSDSTN